MSLPEGPDQQTIIKYIELMELTNARLRYLVIQIESHKLICQLRHFSKITSRLLGKVGFTIAKMSSHKIKHTAHPPASRFLCHHNVRFLVIFQNQTRLIWS